VLEWIRGTNLYANPNGHYYYVEDKGDGTFDLYRVDDGTPIRTEPVRLSSSNLLHKPR
jgi:hypothetical protein